MKIPRRQRAWLAASYSVAVSLSMLGCASASQHTYVAPTDETIVSSTEERTSDPPTHLIYVMNRSTVPVTVFSVALRGCQNIKPRCEPQATNLHIGPGQRTLALRIDPVNPQQGFTYSFSFSWRADSSTVTAVNALADAGDASAREKLASMKHADSVRRADVGPRFNELTPDAFKAIAGKVARLRTEPESLVLVPGERVSAERVRLLVIDKQGQVLGQTRWMRWMTPAQSTIQMVPPNDIVAKKPGRAVFHFRLAEEAERLLGEAPAEVELPIVIAYPVDAHAPMFMGRALDADTKLPLQCAGVALEDSAQNVVVRDVSGHTGVFSLQAPRPGTYRVRIEVRGWSPSTGPSVLAKADEEKQGDYLVRFTEQLLITRDVDQTDFEHARPVAVAADITPSKGRGSSAGSAPLQSVSLGGSDATPVLGLVGQFVPARTFVQFAVDSTGHVDSTSVILPGDVAAPARAAITSVLPRIRFSPARAAGTPVCEMLRMAVDLRAK